jgi:dGTPase
MEWTRLLSRQRLGGGQAGDAEAARTPFQRDHDRLQFSGAVRCLVDKTQVFPMPDDDHVHSRLTHSLEAAAVGRSLGNLVGYDRLRADPALAAAGLEARDVGDVVGAACLAHDVGNPPFGHAGEEAIACWFRERRGRMADLVPGFDLDAERWAEFEAFEGNAQGFRVLVADRDGTPGGMRLTCATLAAFSKYPCILLPDGQARPYRKHGVFRRERAALEEVAAATGLPARGDGAFGRHPLAYLVEAADDICYSVVDVEDGYRLGYLTFEETRAALGPLAARNPAGRLDRHGGLESRAPAAYVALLRAYAINALMLGAHEVFGRVHDRLLAGEPVPPLLDQVELKRELQELKRLGFARCYRAPEVVAVELTGFNVLAGLLEVLVPAVLDRRPSRYLDKVRQAFPQLERHDDAYAGLLHATDLVSGMTDSRALSIYRRVHGMELPGGRRGLGTI